MRVSPTRCAIAARRDQAAFACRGTLLAAFEEVETALTVVTRYAEKIGRLHNRRTILQRSVALATDRYQGGYAAISSSSTHNGTFTRLNSMPSRCGNCSSRHRDALPGVRWRIPIPIPPEFADEPTLLAFLGLSPRELKRIWWFRGRMYHQFEIAKGSGKSRLITAPDQRLSILQSKLRPLLDTLYRVRNPVHGFVPARSVKTNAEAHGRRRFVVNLDLQHFFPTITENRVRGVLKALGVDQRVTEIIARLCCFDSHLPQGASTSPVLSNMICYRLDTDLLRLAKAARAIYTRYADDITFSSYQPPAPLFDGALPMVGRFSPELLALSLRDAFQTNGFILHPDKAHYADRNSRRMVTGVKINAGLNVDRRYIRRIRALLHSIETLGLADAQSKFTGLGGKGALAAHLRGKIAYVSHLKGATDPVVRALALRYNKSFGATPITLVPTPEERRDRSVWVVDHIDQYGSAFFLKGVGLVTAAHCVKGLSEVEILHPSKHTTTFSAKVLKRHDHRDLALLDTSTIPATEYFELDVATTPPLVGDPVTAVGYPHWAPGDRLNHRPGFVSLITPQAGVRKIEVSQMLTLRACRVDRFSMLMLA